MYERIHNKARIERVLRWMSLMEDDRSAFKNLGRKYKMVH